MRKILHKKLPTFQSAVFIAGYIPTSLIQDLHKLIPGDRFFFI